jgi:hypothetical protein
MSEHSSKPDALKIDDGLKTLLNCCFLLDLAVPFGTIRLAPSHKVNSGFDPLDEGYPRKVVEV